MAELKELQNALEAMVRARKRDRATPLTVNRADEVAYGKHMTTQRQRLPYIVMGLQQLVSWLYRSNPRRYSRCWCQSYWGDGATAVHWSRQHIRPVDTFLWDDVFTLEFLPEIARRAVRLDIWQSSDEQTLGNVLSAILKKAPGVISFAKKFQGHDEL